MSSARLPKPPPILVCENLRNLRIPLPTRPCYGYRLSLPRPDIGIFDLTYRRFPVTVFLVSPCEYQELIHVPVFRLHLKKLKASYPCQVGSGPGRKILSLSSFSQTLVREPLSVRLRGRLQALRGQWCWAPRGLQTRRPGLTTREEVRFPLPPPNEHPVAGT